jgi:hypothetical protein
MEPWSIATCEVILFIGAALVGWKDRDFWRWPKYLKWPALLVVVLLVVGLIQLVPLPASWWKAFNAERVLIYEEGLQAEMLLRSDAYRRDVFAPDADKPLPPDTSPILTPRMPAWIPATFTPAATFRALIALLAGACLVLLLERLAARKEHLKRMVALVGFLGLGVAIFAKASMPGLPLGHLLMPTMGKPF